MCSGEMLLVSSIVVAMVADERREQRVELQLAFEVVLEETMRAAESASAPRRRAQQLRPAASATVASKR